MLQVDQGTPVIVDNLLNKSKTTFLLHQLAILVRTHLITSEVTTKVKSLSLKTAKYFCDPATCHPLFMFEESKVPV